MEPGGSRIPWSGNSLRRRPSASANVRSGGGQRPSVQATLPRHCRPVGRINPSRHAASSYSCSNPPSRSRRRTALDLARGSGTSSPIGSGASRARARCGTACRPSRPDLKSVPRITSFSISGYWQLLVAVPDHVGSSGPPWRLRAAKPLSPKEDTGWIFTLTPPSA
jgi:hypothetical protein